MPEIELCKEAQEGLQELQGECPGFTPDQIMSALVDEYIAERKREGA